MYCLKVEQGIQVESQLLITSYSNKVATSGLYRQTSLVAMRMSEGKHMVAAWMTRGRHEVTRRSMVHEVAVWSTRGRHMLRNEAWDSAHEDVAWKKGCTMAATES